MLFLDQNLLFGILGLLAGIIAVVLVSWLRSRHQQTQIELAKNAAARIVEEAKKDASAIKKESEIQAKDSVLKEKGEFEREVRETRRELQNHEKRLISKEEGIDKRIEAIEKRDSELTRRDTALKSREKNIEEKAAECDRQIDAARKQLEQVAGMTREEAKKSLIDQMVEEAKHDSSKRIRVIEEEAKEEAARKSQKIIALAIERLAGDFVAERSVTVMPLPNDELKGKIIGREGRNIRALEAATGIDLIVDDTPETVVISGHNPIRREIARLSLEKLISDGGSTREGSRRWCASQNKSSTTPFVKPAKRPSSMSGCTVFTRSWLSSWEGLNIGIVTRKMCCCIPLRQPSFAA